MIAARRETPVAGWEFPGGKVEPAESPDDALVREVEEELGCRIVVTDWLAGVSPISADLELRIATARLVDGEPNPHEHTAVQWVGADDLPGLDWLEPDRPFLPELRAVLLRPVPRGIFDERDDAEVVAAQLRSDGFEAWTERESFAGEDDDEDHAWAVLTDAPQVRLELLVEDHDGWYDDGEAGPSGPPIDLPRSNRR